MEKLMFKVLLLIGCTSFCAGDFQSGYDPAYVDVSSVQHKSITYDVVTMKRKSEKIKAKYFGARINGISVSDRYKEWAKTKNIVCYTSAGYMDNSRTTVGLTIDAGVLVNATLEPFDGLVIVYETGGVVLSNLDEANLTVVGNPVPQGKKLDIRNSTTDLELFIEWAKNQRATVFQTHLLVHRNKLAIAPNAPTPPRERRFLAVGTVRGELVHAIVNSGSSNATLYEASKRTLEFLQSFRTMNVMFMINLDPGAQDVFQLYDEHGVKSPFIQGPIPLEKAANILAYYFE